MNIRNVTFIWAITILASCAIAPQHLAYHDSLSGDELDATLDKNGRAALEELAVADGLLDPTIREPNYFERDPFANILGPQNHVSLTNAHPFDPAPATVHSQMWSNHTDKTPEYAGDVRDEVPLIGYYKAMKAWMDAHKSELPAENARSLFYAKEINTNLTFEDIRPFLPSLKNDAGDVAHPQMSFNDFLVTWAEHVSTKPVLLQHQTVYLSPERRSTWRALTAGADALIYEGLVPYDSEVERERHRYWTAYDETWAEAFTNQFGLCYPYGYRSKTKNNFHTYNVDAEDYAQAVLQCTSSSGHTRSLLITAHPDNAKLNSYDVWTRVQASADHRDGKRTPGSDYRLYEFDWYAARREELTLRARYVAESESIFTAPDVDDPSNASVFIYTHGLILKAPLYDLADYYINKNQSPRRVRIVENFVLKSKYSRHPHQWSHSAP